MMTFQSVIYTKPTASAPTHTPIVDDLQAVEIQVILRLVYCIDGSTRPNACDVIAISSYHTLEAW